MMSATQIHNVLNKDKIYEKSILKTQVKKSSDCNFKGVAATSMDPNESAQSINEKIARNLHTTEKSALLKYLAQRDHLSFTIPSEKKENLSALEKLKEHSKFPSSSNEGRRRDAREISNIPSDNLTKYNDKFVRETRHLNQSQESKDKGIAFLHDRGSVAFERGDYEPRKDFKSNTKEKCTDFCRSERTPSSFCVKINDNVHNVNHGTYFMKKLSNKHNSEILKWSFECDTNTDEKSESKIRLPRLVQSDLTERRLKQSSLGGVEALRVGPRPPPPPRPDVTRRRLAAETAHPIATTLAALHHHLRQSSSDAQVTLRPVSRRSVRPGKPPVATRPPKVRVPRPFSHFLRGGFHPPEPGVSTSRRPCSHFARSSSTPLQQHRDPQSTWSTILHYATTSQRNTGFIVASNPPGGDGDVHPPDHMTLTSQTAGKRLNSTKIRVKDSTDRTAISSQQISSQSQLSSKTVPSVTSSSPSRSPNTLPNSNVNASKPSANRNLASSADAIDPALRLDAHKVSYPSIPSFLLSVKNRRGKPVSQGPTNYRSVPVLKGNLNLTMPSIREELECEETDIQVEREDVDEPIVVLFENEKKNKSKHSRHLKEITNQNNINNAKYCKVNDKVASVLYNCENDTVKNPEEANSESGRNRDEKKKRKPDKKSRKFTKGKHSRSEEDNRSLKEKSTEKSDKRKCKKMEENEEEQIFQDKMSRKMDAMEEMRRRNSELMEIYENKQQSERDRHLIINEEPIRSREKVTNSRKNKILRDGTHERKLSKSDERKAIKQRSEKQKKTAVRQARTKSVSSTSVVSASAARAAAARANFKKLRRGFRKEKKTVAECIAAERVMARWAQANEELRQREIESGMSGRRRRPGSRKRSAKHGDESEGKEKRGGEQSRALIEQLQLTKRAVRQDEIQLLARAESFTE